MEAPLWLHTAVGGEAMKASGPAEWDQVSCMTCGARDFEVTRPGWAEGLRDWLRFGGPWRPTKRACRRCGTVSSAGSVGALVPYRRGWWSVPQPAACHRGPAGCEPRPGRGARPPPAGRAVPSRALPLLRPATLLVRAAPLGGREESWSK